MRVFPVRRNHPQMLISTVSDGDFLNCVNSCFCDNSSKIEGKPIENTHGFTSQLDADSMPLIIRIIQLTQ